MSYADRAIFGKVMGRGLLCRLAGGCPTEFRAIPSDSSSMAALDVSIKERDAHELESHGYVHEVPAPEKSYGYANPFGRTDANRRGPRAKDLGLTPAGSF